MTAPEPDAVEQMRNAWRDRAEQYAAYAVPKNRPFAEALVRLVAPRPGERVLDVASGPGVVALEVARATGGEAEILATDLTPEWEAYVADAARQAGAAIAFLAMPGEALDLPDAAFDVVLCQFGLMFMPEPGQGLREFRRVLRPGGRLGVAVWSTADKVGHFVPMRALQALLPKPDSPTPPGPLSLSEPGLVERLVREAGFANVEVRHQTEVFTVDDPEVDWQRLSGPGGILTGQALADRGDEELARLHDAVIAAWEPYRNADGVIRVPSEAIIVTATRPA